jgi:hypothetical protein
VLIIIRTNIKYFIALLFTIGITIPICTYKKADPWVGFYIANSLA